MGGFGGFGGVGRVWPRPGGGTTIASDGADALSLPASPAPLPAGRLGHFQDGMEDRRNRLRRARRARKNTTEDTENTEKSQSEFGPEASNQVDFDNVLHLAMLRFSLCSLCTLWFNLRSLYVF